MKNLLRSMRNLPPILLSVLLLAATIIGCRAMVSIGSTAGETAGKITGTVLGSYYAVTEDIPEALADGRNEGLSAEDTIAELQVRMSSEPKLEVMEADVQLELFTAVGGTQTDVAQSDDTVYTPTDYAYAELSTRSGTAIFTVALDKAEVSLSEDSGTVSIQIPKPEYKVTYDDTSEELLAKYQKKSSKTGSTADGMQANANAVKQAKVKAEAEIQSDTNLQERAEDAAIRQVQLLAKSICGANADVNVSFLEEG